MIKAVLFDLDDLLVDTEGLNIKSMTKTLRKHGIKLTNAEQKGLIGITNQKFLNELFKRRKLNHNFKKILEENFQSYEQLLKDKLRAFPGAMNIVKKLNKKGFRLAIVSGSTRKQVLIILKKLRIGSFFETIVAYEDVKYGKPSPDPYLTAVRKLRLKPKDCIVLEDAETGIKSAKRARIKVIGVVNKGRQSLKMADKVVENLNSAYDFILQGNN